MWHLNQLISFVESTERLSSGCSVILNQPNSFRSPLFPKWGGNHMVFQSTEQFLSDSLVDSPWINWRDIVRSVDWNLHQLNIDLNQLKMIKSFQRKNSMHSKSSSSELGLSIVTSLRQYGQYGKLKKAVRGFNGHHNDSRLITIHAHPHLATPPWCPGFNGHCAPRQTSGNR